MNNIPLDSIAQKCSVEFLFHYVSKSIHILIIAGYNFEHSNFVSDANLAINIAKAGYRYILKNDQVLDFVAINTCVLSVSSRMKIIKNQSWQQKDVTFVWTIRAVYFEFSLCKNKNIEFDICYNSQRCDIIHCLWCCCGDSNKHLPL